LPIILNTVPENSKEVNVSKESYNVLK